MADYIPFVLSKKGAKLVAQHYGDCTVARVPITAAPDLAAALPGVPLWIDGCADGFGKPGTAALTDDFTRFFSSVESASYMASEASYKSPDKPTVKKFVWSLLDKCAELSPAWLSIPQLTAADGTARNKINRALAGAAGDWRAMRRFKGTFVLPLIIVHQSQVSKKGARDSKVTNAAACFADSAADAVWAVDSSLTDDNGSKTNRDTRFPGVINLHTELRDAIPAARFIGGPYWGLNLVLWARGLIDHPAIGVASGYQYYPSGGQANQPRHMVALSGLRRRATIGVEFKTWLTETTTRLGSSHPMLPSFQGLLAKYGTVSGSREAASQQVAAFYKEWFLSVASSASPSRAVGLYQDLSLAYALGKSLAPLPAIEKTARKPECIAEYLMLSCL